MPSILLVMIGGALGAGCRYLTGTAALRLFGPGLPWGTLLANLIGGLLMGVLAATLARFGAIQNEPLRLFAGVGVLGGFTTFSAFSLEVVTMAMRGDVALALGYALISVAGAALALYGGLVALRALG